MERVFALHSWSVWCVNNSEVTFRTDGGTEASRVSFEIFTNHAFTADLGFASSSLVWALYTFPFFSKLEFQLLERINEQTR